MPILIVVLPAAVLFWAVDKRSFDGQYSKWLWRQADYYSRVFDEEIKHWRRG